MIQNPIDVATRISPSLSTLIENRLKSSKAEQDITLSTIHDFLTGLLTKPFIETEQLHHFDINESLLDELNALIEEFGEYALAVDFVKNAASEALSRVINAVMNGRDQESPPTLGVVKEAIISGLPASLVGTGILEEDEDDDLLAEIEALINKHGVDSLAEEFLRYE